MKAKLHDILLHYFDAITINTVETLQNGLINSTYKAETSQGIFIIQKINEEVFSNISGVLNNKIKVVNYLNTNGFPTVKFLKTRTGMFYIYAEDGFWQVSEYIASSVKHIIESPEMAEQLGRYLARFHSALIGFPISELDITIPDFHNTGKRYTNLLASSASASEERQLKAHQELEYINNNIESIRWVSEAIQNKIIPQRVVHNDTKVGNFLFNTDGKLLTIIDFDTVMPGSVLHDIGDALRTGASTASEDEQDLLKVGFNSVIYEAFIKGYLRDAKSFLTPNELHAIHFSLPIILLEQACRFLEDYLRNDVYYGAQYATHNLVRAQTQLHVFKKVKHYLNTHYNIL